MVEHLPITQGDVAATLQLAVHEQSVIGCWDKLLLGMSSAVWKALQDIIDDSANPKPPKRSAADWLNAAVHQLIKFSLRCWKTRNTMIHGSTQQEKSQFALQSVREKIIKLYRDPPDLAPRYSSIFDIPLEHRLKMPLQVAKRWLHLITHQARVTQHNTRSSFSVSINQSHLIFCKLRINYCGTNYMHGKAALNQSLLCNERIPSSILAESIVVEPPPSNLRNQRGA